MVSSSDPTLRFSDRVENYVKFRPGYPSELIDFMREQLGMTSDKVVAEIGSGTGIMTRLLLKNGNDVFAVEPNDPMRAEAERALRGDPRFHSVKGRAEATTLPGAFADFAVAAQSFHWFDAEAAKKEFQRILKPSGLALILWNERTMKGSPFAEGYEKLLVDFGTDYDSVKVGTLKSQGILENFFGSQPVLKKVFPSSQILDFERLKGRLLSTSYCPAPSHGNFKPIMNGLKKIFDECQKGGLVEMVYETTIYYGRVL